MRGLISLLVVGCFLGACSGAGEDQIVPGVNESLLQVRTYVDVNSDIEAIRFTLTPCGDTEGAIVIDRPLEDQIIPGNIPELQDNPLDADSEHVFADLFKMLEAGCYDVHAQPLGADGANSKTCAPAWKKNVLVLESSTTEVFLLIQCLGHDKGAIDVIAAINHEPALDDVWFEDSKFVCGGIAVVCLEGSDVDKDPLEFELLAEEGCEVSPVGPGRQATAEQCFEVVCHDQGKFDLRARVYDLAFHNGDQIRIEDWLALAGYPNESHAELNFWIYFDGIKYYPDNDGDGFGDASAEPTLFCDNEPPPDGYVEDNTDCDDDNAAVNPGMDEVCHNDIDDNCNGEIDEDCLLPASIIYSDNDYGCGWENYASTVTIDNSYEIGINLAVYASMGSGAVNIMQARHNGDYNPDPGSLDNLVSRINALTPVAATNLGFADLGITDLSTVNMLYVTGHNAFSMSPIEKDALLEYIEKGGFVFADDCSNALDNQGFETGFRSMVLEVFGAGMTVLSVAHDVYSSFYSLNGADFSYSAAGNGTEWNQEPLEGLGL